MISLIIFIVALVGSYLGVVFFAGKPLLTFWCGVITIIIVSELTRI